MEFLASRPSTAGLRPGTAGSRRGVASGVTASSDIGPNVEASNADTLISLEVGQDDFLRITNHDRFARQNKALLAAEDGNVNEILRLVDDGLDVVSCRGLNGLSLLHIAASKGHGFLISELIRLGILVNIRNDSQETPLHLSVYGGHILAVDQLLDFGAEIDAQNSDEETSLFYAARRNYPPIVRLLVQRGANINITDSIGDKAADHTSNLASLQHLTETHLGATAANEQWSYHVLLHVMSYLTAQDLMRVACVCSKWHRISESEHLWKALGVRKWEIALKSSLGFAPTATSAVFRPSRNNSLKTKSNSGKKLV
jgi:hypothetical protein